MKVPAVEGSKEDMFLLRLKTVVHDLNIWKLLFKLFCKRIDLAARLADIPVRAKLYMKD